MKIFKYQLKLQDEQILLLPKGAEILTVQTQTYRTGINELVWLWAIVDEKETDMEERHLYLFFTGLEFNLELHTYIGTFQIHFGKLIFHLFEKGGIGYTLVNKGVDNGKQS